MQHSQPAPRPPLAAASRMHALAAPEPAAGAVACLTPCALAAALNIPSLLSPGRPAGTVLTCAPASWPQDQLNTFNANIKNAISQLQDSCGTLNCLNMTDVVPSQRNARAGTNCVSSSRVCSQLPWLPANAAQLSCVPPPWPACMVACMQCASLTTCSCQPGGTISHALNLTPPGCLAAVHTAGWWARSAAPAGA